MTRKKRPTLGEYHAKDRRDRVKIHQQVKRDNSRRRKMRLRQQFFGFMDDSYEGLTRPDWRGRGVPGDPALRRYPTVIQQKMDDKEEADRRRVSQ